MEIHQYDPHIEENSIVSSSPHVEEITDLRPKMPYTISHKEVNTFRRITRAYTE